jgi:hypothetical protein
MPYPNLASLQSQYDQYGNALEVSPLVARGTAGSLAPGQSLFSASLRESAGNNSTLTFPLFIVPSNGCWFLTDMQATGAAIASAAELVLSIQAGSIIIAQCSLGATSPISCSFETQPMVPPGTMVSVVVTNANATTPAFAFFLAGFYQQFGF